MRSTPIDSRSCPTVLLVGLVLFAGCGSANALGRESDAIAEVLRLEPGVVVADVGAGEGEWTVALAETVGREGHVWATEVDEDDLVEIRKRAAGAGLENVTTLLGDQDRTGLPPSCCDAILLRMVYHHFVRPERMRESLYQALRPDGLLAIVDIAPQTGWRRLPEVPDRGGHGIPPEELIDEMTASGFVLLERIDRWNGDADRYCLVFSR